MAVTITGFKAFPIDLDAAMSYRAIQYYELTFTQAATDVTMDLASCTAGALGTFWTSAVASAGNYVTSALATLQAVIANAESRFHWRDTAIQDVYQQVSAAAVVAANQFQITNAAKVPNILFSAANAPTSLVFRITFLNNPGTRGIKAGAT